MTLIEHNAEDSSDEDEEVRGSGGAINCIRYAVRGHIQGGGFELSPPMAH